MNGLIRREDVLFMFESGATHNFITPSMTKRLELKESTNAILNILLGTWMIVKGSEVCKIVNFTIQG